MIGPGTVLPAPVAVVLARFIDHAAPTDDAIAQRCAPKAPVILTRFAYSTGPVDVLESVGCPAGAVAYVHGHGYVLPALVGSYLEGATDTGSEGLTPDVLGQPLPRAESLARRRGDSLGLDGELVDNSATGTVLLQYPTLDNQVTVIAAVHRSPPCRVGQLAIQYLPGGAGTGNDFGTILLRNHSASWCEFDGPATVTGRIAGRPVTRTRNVSVTDDLELSPHAVAAEPGHEPVAADQLVAALRLAAGYRDDEDGAVCVPHWVVPTAWRIVLGSGAFTVANGRATANARPPGAGGLITCRGRFGAGPVQIATS